MQVFSRAARVLEPSGEQMTVGTALSLINQVLDELVLDANAELDEPSRCVAKWFEQFGFGEGPFDSLELPARSANVIVDELSKLELIEARGGRARARAADELLAAYARDSQRPLSTWAATLVLAAALGEEGEAEAARWYRRLDAATIEGVRELCYRCYLVASRRDSAQDAQLFNALVASLPAIASRASDEHGHQARLDEAL